MTSPIDPGPSAPAPSAPGAPAGRVALIGTGLIGGSIGLALRALGWHVTGRDLDPARAQRALELGAHDSVGEDPEAEITFVATPVAAITVEAQRALAGGGIVTDVGSTKAAIVASVDHPRDIGGHPMAGSEQEGVDGADPALFEGSTWVLTPTQDTDPHAYGRLQSVLSSIGADVVAVGAGRHDDLVAMVSHVPHLTAVTLMGLAADRAEEHATLLRLAAGGFRDMTRIAAGHPGIWPDICAENRDAIVATLDRLVDALADIRQVVAGGDRARLLSMLERARAARVNLPSRVPKPEDVVEVRVPVPDRPGVLAEVTTLAGELDVNIYDLEIAHSAEGDRGVLLLVVAAEHADLVRGGLLARGYRPSLQRVG